MRSRPHMLNLSCHPEAYGSRLHAALPNGAAGAWCRLRVTCAGGASWWVKAELRDESRGQVVREVFLGPVRAARGRSWRETLVHIPQAARDITLLIFGEAGAQQTASLAILSRMATAARLLRHGWRQLPAALAGTPDGMLGRARAVLGQAPARAGQAPPYACWRAWFEPSMDSFAMPAPAWNAEIVIGAGGQALTDASLHAAAHQGLPVRIVRQAADWDGIASDWVILVQAGEILSRHAAAQFAQAAALCPWAACLTADLDHLDADGCRHAPLFKPGPDPLLLETGLTVRGACAIRWRNVPAGLPGRADAARLLLARQTPDRVAHIPCILTHVTQGVPSLCSLRSPPEPAPGATMPHVTMIVPSAARGAHVVRCLRKVTVGTQYPAFDLKLILSAPGRPAILRRLALLPRIAIMRAGTAPFNYARVNNEAASTVDSELLLLLNDDVSPIRPDWLHAMVRHMRDPRVGIVGARLLYGNGMVQHEGVIMGLANLCEHAGRLRQASDSGLHGLALLDRQVSAVTGACMLIRTSLYRSLGGMDTAYAVALNDVDLCLRAREAGWRVVYCAGAELYHYESLSLGRHYAGSRAGLESQEVRRLRSRFASVIAADPFYSPSASLQPGREWQPGFPPRPAPPAMGAPP